MLDYVFFDDGLRLRFEAFLAASGIPCEMADDVFGSIVSIPEDIDDELADAVDAFYEELLASNAEMLEGTEEALEKNVAGIRIELADGRACMVRVDPRLMNQALSCLSLAELEELVKAVARAVENPDDRPLCHLEPKA